MYIYIYIYIYIKPHLCSSSCCQRDDSVLKAIPRESYCQRLLISRNFGDSNDIYYWAKLSFLMISIVLPIGVIPC